MKIITVNNQLSFMHASALSRGLPHQSIRNLCLLSHHQIIFNQKKEKKWLANHPFDDHVFRIPAAEDSDSRNWKQAMKQKEEATQAEASWDMLEETIKMAEGQSGLVFGRPRFARADPPWWRNARKADGETRSQHQSRW